MVFRLTFAPGRVALLAAALAALLALAPAAPVRAASLPGPGDVLPPLVFQNCPRPEDRAALGVGDGPTFALADVRAGLILFEFFGVYCPVCFEQAPDFNRLVRSLSRDPATAGTVRVLALAAGATPMELEYARGEMKAAYPMCIDPDFSVHKQLGEPKTPFAMLLRPDGTVLWSHLGRIEDPGALLNLIKSKL